MRDGTFKLGGLGAAVTAFACSVSPVPEPPDNPELGAAIEIERCATPPCDGVLTLRGAPGVAKRASRVWGVNLDATDPPTEAEVNADGSFTLYIAAPFGSEVRLQARRDAARSAPRDFRVEAEGAPSMFPGARRAFGECFPAPLEVELEPTALGSSASRLLSLRSSCPADLEIASIALRTPHPAFSIEPRDAFVLAGGASLEVPVVFTPSDTSTVEEVLLIEIAGPESDRRAITLFGRGRQ